MPYVTLPRPMLIDPNGTPRVAARMHVYDAGTTTPHVAYTGPDLLVQHPDPILSLANGYFPSVWVNPTGGAYKLTFEDANGVPLPIDQDNIPASENLTSAQIAGVLDSLKLTEAELAAGVTPVNYAYAPYDARRYGVTGDGSTDDRAALVTALSIGEDIYIASGLTVLISSTVSLLNDQTLYGDGYQSKISCNGTNTNTISISGKTRAVVRDLFVAYTGTTSSGSNGAAVLINSSSTYCTVTRCRIEGVRAGVTITVADDNVIENNDITNVTIAAPEGSWDIGIYLGGSRNRIVNNRCFGSSASGIQCLSDFTTSADRNIITGNHISEHHEYGILCYANLPGGTAEKNVIANNIIWNISGLSGAVASRAKGAGIYVASAEWTTVVGNVIEFTNQNTDAESLAPGAIGINGVSCATVSGNVIKRPFWYGIYIVLDGNGQGSVIVSDNLITAPALSGIRVKNMTDVTIADNALHDGDDAGIYVTHSTTATGISIQGNRVRGFDAAAGIRVENVQCPNISGNYINGAVTGLQVDNLVGALILGNEVRSSVTTDVSIGSGCSGFLQFDRNTVRSVATTGINDQAGLTYGENDVAGQGTPFGGIGLQRTLTTSATPSVLGTRMAIYAGATAITDLLNSIPGQVITIRATNNITLNHNAGAATTKLMLNGAANFSMVANNTCTLLYPPGGPWYEIARKV